MSANKIDISPVNETDLDTINRVIEAAIMTWALPQRVKRLSLQLYRYSRTDLVHLDMVVAKDHNRRIAGVAAWEEADPKDAPAGRRALLLHGIYVDPAQHRQGIGRRLFDVAEAAVCQHQCDGLLVKVQQDASAFFESMGMHRLTVDEPRHQYANRFWKESSPRPAGPV